MHLTNSITIIPVIHGKATVAAHIRSLCLNKGYDCIAVDLPECFATDIADVVDALPLISALVAREEQSATAYYLPIDPCDGAIEGLRQARQNYITPVLIGYPVLQKPLSLPPLPDEYTAKDLGYDLFSALCLHATGIPAAQTYDDIAALYLAHKLHGLSVAHNNILALVHCKRFIATVNHFKNEQSYNAVFPEPPRYRIAPYLINPDHLYFTLGELPYVCGKLEQARQDMFAAEPDLAELYKNLFRDTRRDYSESRAAAAVLSISRIQSALTFLRNLTVNRHGLLPSLFDIVIAAKGVGGNAYALQILKAAKYYPFLPIENSNDLLAIGIDRMALPGDSAPCNAINLLRDFDIEWRQISLKVDPTPLQKKEYRFQWNPSHACSHLPEDRSIESFNTHIRHKAHRLLCEGRITTEEFVTSLKDGIDIRETARNWYRGRIYVKDAPPVQGRMDTVIIIFDETHDEIYPQRTTWYAEHAAESTLSFYATDPFADLIGPGIARCFYGGLSLIFPPRPAPNPFELFPLQTNQTLAWRLSVAALLFSKEKNVAYVADKKPSLALRMQANRLKRRLVWIPFSTFSAETRNRLRMFHVLNGRTVRSWAGRFIGD
ncbi:MAG: hypothetical protein PHC61_01110 [Chitinivibrionales bacterium]|nr:hypothetical protein [Chitinivibrionales bacterium]